VKTFRESVAIALVVVGTLALIGCIYVPGSFQPSGGGPRPETKVGAINSDKPLRVGRSTREDVFRELGRDDVTEPDHWTLVYSYRIDTGAILSICGGLPLSESRELRLEFGDDGVLRTFSVHKG
jgi:hypothetical protein